MAQDLNSRRGLFHELTPSDLPLLEPDLLGAVSMLLYGQRRPVPAEVPPSSASCADGEER